MKTDYRRGLPKKRRAPCSHTEVAEPSAVIRILVSAALLVCASITLVVAQVPQCAVSGYLYNPDGSPAIDASVNAVQVDRTGASYVITPIVLTTDRTGWTTFFSPQGSAVWIRAATLGLLMAGDVAVMVPNDVAADLNLLGQSAKPPVSGISVLPGPIPVMSLSLTEFGVNLGAAASAPVVESFNGRTGAVTVTFSDITNALSFSPVDPTAVVEAVNASAATIDDARVSPNIARQNFANVFETLQAFEKGITVTGAPQPGNIAATIQKGIGSSSGLDLELDGTGKALRFNSSALGKTYARSYFNDVGMFYTDGWVVISGTSRGTGDSFGIEHPSNDPFMLGIWSDVAGPALQVRASSAPGSYLFSGLDQFTNYTFGVEADGRLLWGATTRAAMDTSLYRNAAGSLRTDAAFQVGGGATIGGSATVGGSLTVSGATVTLGDAHFSRFTPGGLSSSGAFLVNGRLNIGATDTHLYRQAAGALRTDGSVSVGGTGLFGGPVYFGTVDTTLYRTAPSSLRTNSSMTVDGKLGVGGTNAGYPLYVLGSQASSWNTAARFEASQNVNGGGAVVEVFPTTMPFGARLYGGRWSSTDRGARLAGRDQLGRENAWVHVNAEDASIAINTVGLNRLTVKSNGNVGINTTAPATDAILEVNGGDTRGFRIAPRSVPGSPATGTWTGGTIIVDSTGVVYICVATGTPGTWQKLGAQ
jgi:hypothetical protein